MTFLDLEKRVLRRSLTTKKRKLRAFMLITDRDLKEICVLMKSVEIKTVNCLSSRLARLNYYFSLCTRMKMENILNLWDWLEAYLIIENNQDDGMVLKKFFPHVNNFRKYFHVIEF